MGETKVTAGQLWESRSCKSIQREIVGVDHQDGHAVVRVPGTTGRPAQLAVWQLRSFYRLVSA